ncbi:MAG: hypothetical protein D6725_06765 [Planctomycetota bacterium]|nr:MAG: hypothetical protein D6725_06765 [Planctomycetota bacterium]
MRNTQSDRRSLEEVASACCVTIRDAEAFRMPKRCVVCGEEPDELLSYTQDHLPLVAPGVAVIRTTEVAIPYCPEHRAAFQMRMRVLRCVQAVLYLVLAAWATTALVEPLRVALGWPPEPSESEMVCGVALLLVLFASIVGIKPLLYDVFIRRSGNRLFIKCRSREFIQAVVEHNSEIVE